ncbi:MAG TPA: helix-turn-helix transcriptional regulator [Solirubrobacterales bacterium]|nr:helix-turn-helix transcriptional regulator [Solirubrobacterales bacterium]
MGADLTVARRFGANLRQLRRQADLSQEEVGARASLHRTEIGLLERGARVPRIDTLVSRRPLAYGSTARCWRASSGRLGRPRPARSRPSAMCGGEGPKSVSSTQKPKTDPE